MFTAVAVGGEAAGARTLSPAAAPSGPAAGGAYGPPPGAPPPVAAYAPAPPAAAYAPPAAYAPAPPAVAAFASPPVAPSHDESDEDPPWEIDPPPPPGPARGEVYHSEFDEDEGVAQRAVRRHRGPIVMGLGIAGLVMFCVSARLDLGGIAVHLRPAICRR